MTTAQTWARIHALLKAHHPEIGAGLLPGARPDEVAETEDELSLTFPADFRDSLLVHNGSSEDAPSLLSIYGFVDLETIVEIQRGVTQQAREMFGDDSPWTPAFIPIANSMETFVNLLFLDTATSRVYMFTEETGTWHLWGETFGAWLTAIADDLEAGRLRWDEDQGVLWPHDGTDFTEEVCLPVVKLSPRP